MLTFALSKEGNCMSYPLKIVFGDFDQLILHGRSAPGIYGRRQNRQLVERLLPAFDFNAPILTEPRAVGTHSLPFLGKETALLAAETGGVGAAGSRAAWTSISSSRVWQAYMTGFAARMLTEECFDRRVEAAHH